MGSPKKFRKTYSRPTHPWQKDRILEEIGLTKEFGFKNKREIYKVTSLLSSLKRQAKTLSASPTEQSKKETAQLFTRLQRLGLLKEPTYDAVLELGVKDIARRRLQSVLVVKGYARSVKQARQFITHQHVKVGEKTITSPSYMVPVEEEALIVFNERSTLADESHPERAIAEKEVVAEEKAEAPSETEEKPAEKKAGKKPAAKKEEPVAQESPDKKDDEAPKSTTESTEEEVQA